MILIFHDFNFRISLLLAILIIMDNLNFRLSRVERENSFITSGFGWFSKTV